jgi:hypothetical protein
MRPQHLWAGLVPGANQRMRIRGEAEIIKLPWHSLVQRKAGRS